MTEKFKNKVSGSESGSESGGACALIEIEQIMDMQGIIETIPGTEKEFMKPGNIFIVSKGKMLETGISISESFDPVTKYLTQENELKINNNSDSDD